MTNQIFDTLKELIKGPISPKLSPVLSDKIFIKSIFLEKNKILTINFDETSKSLILKSSISELFFVYSIVNTLTGGPVRGQNINCIAVDPVNRKWLGTNQGLFLMSSDGIQAYESIQSSDSPLPSDEIKSMAIDESQGIVYVGTDFGLTVLETSSIAPVDSYNELKVFPNPSNSIFTVEGKEVNNIQVFDISGVIIFDINTHFLNGVQEVAGSNPVAPTITSKRVMIILVTFKTALFSSL